MGNAAKKSEPSSLLLFKESIRLFEELVNTHAQIPGREISEGVWKYFLTLTAEQQHSVIEQITAYTEILIEATNEKISLTGDKRLSWFALKKLNLIPPSQLLELVKENDYTEVYNQAGVQIFRNLEFYKLVSYSIAEMTLHPFHELYHRDQAVLDQIIQQGFVQGFSGIKEPYKLNIDVHEGTEINSNEARKFQVSFGYLAPIVDKNHKVAAVFATSQVKRLYIRREKIRA